MARLVAARSEVPAVSSLTLAAPWLTKIAPQTAADATPTWEGVVDAGCALAPSGPR
jgi:hypothetical protein